MNFEAVLWLDSGLSMDEGWKSVDHYVDHAKLDRMEVWTVGFVMHENDDVLIVAASYDPAAGLYLNAHAIAKSAIIERRSIGLPVEDREIAA